MILTLELNVAQTTMYRIIIIMPAAVTGTAMTAIGKKSTVMLMRIKRTSGYESGCITMNLLNWFNLDLLLSVPNPTKCDVINVVNPFPTGYRGYTAAFQTFYR